jgi:hypothetical protein
MTLRLFDLCGQQQRRRSRELRKSERCRH